MTVELETPPMIRLASLASLHVLADALEGQATPRPMPEKLSWVDRFE